MNSLRGAREMRPPLHNLFRLCTLKQVSRKRETAAELCTSCEGCAASVEAGGKPRNAAPLGPIRASGLQNRLPARIFTVDIRHRGSKIRAVRFSNSAIARFPPGLRWV